MEKLHCYFQANPDLEANRNWEKHVNTWWHWNSFLWCPLWHHIFLSIKLVSPAIWDFSMIWWWVSGYVFLVQKITKHSGYQKWRYSPYIRLYGYGFFSQGTPTPKVAKASSTCNFWYLSFTNQTPKRFSQVGVVLPYHFPSGRSPTLDSIIKASPSPWERKVSSVSSHLFGVWKLGFKSSTRCGSVNHMSLMQGFSKH